MQTPATFSPAQLSAADHPLAITPQELATNATDYLLWGTAVGTAAIVQAVAPELEGLSFRVAVAGAGLAAFGFHFYRGLRQELRSGQGEAVRLLRLATWVLLAVLPALVPRLGWATVLPLLLFAMGTRTFVAGGILQRRTLIFGGAAAWVFATMALRLPAPADQMLLLAAGAAAALLLPGAVLRAATRA
ncbi:hypothetical protein SAMN02745146_0292 [Hymenobacter daecheongensis DSM 21074]|uniref:Uncharacterized protein n=1 Tax=Hymenobacter daecheongensis DSM 21074 TaxID=1121955 RepID=A0A1M6MJ24_9BACT|nr:hypothetical protein [Hymenobacter daecheongensis]SHJ83479.1 hypothetical protein SAMN02745146_0292 [Hymenobacter daecheongensis DSM 21074]